MNTTKQGPRVLLVEDEESYIDALELTLSRDGFQVEVARDGAEALVKFAASEPDVVLLDVMLPKVSGIDVCRRIRATSRVPIIMVTAKASEIDTVVGLEVGADDYIAKPYRIRELVARMNAVMRRSQPIANEERSTDASSSAAGSDVLRIGGVELDLDEHRVSVDGAAVSLPLKEFTLLHHLIANAGRVMTRDMLITKVWGHDYYGDTKTLDVHIKRLRAKIEADPANPTRIATVRGVGYRFERT